MGNFPVKNGFLLDIKDTYENIFIQAADNDDYNVIGRFICCFFCS